GGRHRRPPRLRRAVQGGGRRDAGGRRGPGRRARHRQPPGRARPPALPAPLRRHRPLAEAGVRHRRPAALPSDACHGRVPAAGLCAPVEPTLTDLSRDPWLLPVVDALTGANMPAFMSWESPGNWRWHGMYERYPAHQLCLVVGEGTLVAAANGVPVRWDGTASSLPAGSDEVLVEAVDQGPPDRPDAVCMLSVSVDCAHRAAGHAERLLTEVRARAVEHGPRGVI